MMKIKGASDRCELSQSGPRHYNHVLSISLNGACHKFLFTCPTCLLDPDRHPDIGFWILNVGKSNYNMK